MSFTRQDLFTFLIGMGAAILVPLAEALIRSQEIVDDPIKWGIAVGTGMLTAIGRYLLTELTQRGLTGRN